MAEKQHHKRTQSMEPQPQPASRSRAFFKKLKQPSSFSKPQLAIFIVAFGIIGYFVYHSFAAASVVATLEGEQMTAQLASASQTEKNVAQSGSSKIDLASTVKFSNLTLPALSGSATIGSTLTASTGSWSPTPTSYRYNWFLCNSSGSSCVKSPTAADQNTYVIQSGDKGYTIRAQVAPNGEWNYSKDTSASAVVTAPVTSGTFTNTALPTLSGTASVGSTLVATNGSWTPTPSSYGYSWFLCDSSGNACVRSATSANQNTYVIQSGDVGHTVVVQVAPNSLWAQSKDSKPTAVVTSTSINFSVITDSTASGGKAVKFGGGVKLTGSVSLSASGSSLTVSAHGSSCGMVVAVDGTSYINTSVSSTSWTAYSANTSLTSGSHTLSITNTGASTCMLYVDVTNFYGAAPSPTPAPTVALSASPTSVTAGQSATLTWSSTNATSCTASGAWSGTEATSGSVSTGALNQSSTYSLTCIGTGGSATASTTVTVSTTTSSGGIPGVGTLDWGTEYSYETNLDKYAVLGLSGGSERNAYLYPNQTTIGYVSAAATESYWVGVNNTDASANDWYLHCADGSLIHNSVYTNEMLLDPGYASYQSAFVSQTQNFISKYSLKGVYIDEFNSDASARHPLCANGTKATYPFYNKAGQVVISDPSAWQAAMVSWIKTVGPALKSHGDYVEVNGAAGGTVTGWDDTGAATKTWMTSYAPYVSNASVEYWMEGNTTYLRSTGTSAWWEHWDTWESLAEYVQSLGIDFSGVEHYPSGSCTNLQWQRYTRASFMLAWNGKGHSAWTTMGRNCNTWSTVTAYNPGLPTGARTQIAPGVWQRNFQNGTVVINTNASSVTVNVNGKSISLGATDAALM